MRQPLTCLAQKGHGWTYEYFHGPGGAPHDGGARAMGLADDDSTHNMSHVVQEITYGDLWGKGKDAKKVQAHGPPNWLLTAYEGLAHFH
mmetsp:Transcript_18423/g.45247  ORF Transcript_18423/g.45247 Transcript_18423/m.45247 type:complete len:89 (-) Transcript_18423:536-802(-)